MTQHIQNTPQFFLTAPAPCPYLEDKVERKVFTHLTGSKASEINDLLTQGGFRRSQNIAYRPVCENCQACVSVRIIADDFKMNRSMKRIWQNNKDLIGTVNNPDTNNDQYALFHEYLEARHRDGGMSGMSVQDYTMMVEDTHVTTKMIEYRRRGPDSFITGKGEGELIAVALTDVLSDGLSMVYSFYKPELHSRSLGTYMILDHLHRARQYGLPHVYLGYWVNGSRKMEYKIRFRPQEQLGPRGWQRVD
ncbi:arginyltransferase [Paenochrobactrum pullorum]|uniref:arginyltransferase n=1 Tax=Paenochrobactrum pullorum TaxID=1324351 RepID=UPI0035BC507F